VVTQVLGRNSLVRELVGPSAGSGTRQLVRVTRGVTGGVTRRELVVTSDSLMESCGDPFIHGESVPRGGPAQIRTGGPTQGHTGPTRQRQMRCSWNYTW
jgi:hypothetical protein